MKATVEIEQCHMGFYAVIKIDSKFLDADHHLETDFCASKGQLKRKICQFCGDLNLEYEIIN